MKKLLYLFAILSGISTQAQLIIQDVTVVDVEKKKLIPHQSVTIIMGRIEKIENAGKSLKTGNVIDGRGKFLMPGMTDAHIHFFQSGGIYTRPDAIDLRKFRSFATEAEWVHRNMEDFGRRYLREGITSVIDVGSTYSFLQQRDSFDNKWYAPTIYMTGPLLTSYEPSVFKNLGKDEPFILAMSPEQGVKGVQDQQAYKPDFIKIWYIVNESSKDSLEASAKRYQPVVKAIIDESHKKGLKVAVHATQQYAAKLAVESGADFLVHGIEDEIISDDFVKLLKEKKVIDCPTLIVENGYGNSFAGTQTYSTYELNRSNPFTTSSIEDLRHLSDTQLIRRYRTGASSPRYKSMGMTHDSIRAVNLKKMVDGGVIIAAGTDAGNIGTQHATSYFPELMAMKAAGMNNWQVLQSATMNPPMILNQKSGQIKQGYDADLLLLSANPAEDLQALKKIDLIINKGYSIKPDTLVRATPELLVQQQVAAYNLRDVEAFLEPYADSVELYMFPNKLLGKGKDLMRKHYSRSFKASPNAHVEISKRIVAGNMVVDEEIITGTPKPLPPAIAAYYIENGKITKVYFSE